MKTVVALPLPETSLSIEALSNALSMIASAPNGIAQELARQLWRRLIMEYGDHLGDAFTREQGFQAYELESRFAGDAADEIPF